MGEPATETNVLRLCGVLNWHFAWGIILILLGFTTIVARFVDKLRPWHSTMGLLWIYGIIIQIATSMYVRNDGFKTFIFSFLMILTMGIIFGHACIRKYKFEMEKLKKAPKNQTQLVEKGSAGEAMMADDEFDFKAASETMIDFLGTQVALKRFKTAHAFFMSLSFVMLFGAGILFTSRATDLTGCKDLFSEDQAFEVGNVVYEKDGALWLGPDPALSAGGDL